jgi:hypothetical protein
LEAEAPLAPEIDPVVAPGIRLRGGADPVVACTTEALGADTMLLRQLSPQAGRIAARLQSQVFQHQVGASSGDPEADHPRYPHRIRGGQFGQSRRLSLEQVEPAGRLALDEEAARAVAEPEGLADVAALGSLAAANLEG